MAGFCVRASHFRSGNITWKRLSATNSIQFTVNQAWRTDAYSNIRVGSVVSTGTTLSTGLHNVAVNLTVTSVNLDENWFYGTFVYNETSYPATGTYNAYISNCCRLDTLSNNDNGNFRITATVSLDSLNNAPVANIPPYINLQANTANNTFQIPAFDLDGDSLTFSLTPNDSFGIGCVQPSGLSITPSGLLTFNTTGKNPGSMWNANVTIRDQKGAMVQLDFLIALTTYSSAPYFDYGSTPGNTSTFQIYPGQTLNFDVTAADIDANDAVSLSAVGLPVGAVFTAGSGNPVMRTFSWTPTSTNLSNTYQVHFTAQDNQGTQAHSYVNIIVVTRPTFRGGAPTGSSAFCVVPGQTVTNTLMAGGTGSSQFSLVSGPSLGLSFSTAMPTAWSNPVTTTYTYTPPIGTWGVKKLIVKAADQQNGYDFDTVSFVVNTPPVITSLPLTTGAVGQVYSYLLVATDADLLAGDHVSLHHQDLPPFLTATDLNNGTILISSNTPITAAQAGTYNIKITVQDLLGHAEGTHCGVYTQSFTLNLPACNTATTASITAATPDFCNTQLLTATTAATGTYTYSWTYNNQVKSTAQTLRLGLTDPEGVYSVKVTKSGCTSMAAQYYYNPVASMPNFGLIAAKEISLGASNAVYNSSIGVWNGNGKIKLDQNTIVNSPGAVVMANKIQRYSNNNAPNRLFLPVSFTTYPPMQYNSASTAGLSNITVTKAGSIANKKDVLVKAGITATLTGTIYGKITLEKKAVVIFTQSTVSIAGIDMGDTSQLRVQVNNTALKVANTVKVSKGCKINPAGLKLTFYMADLSPDVEKFTVTGGGINMIGNVYMPWGKLHVGGSAQYANNLTGQFIGETIFSDGYVNWYPYNCAAPPSFPARMAGIPEEGQQPFAFYVTPNPTVNDFEFRVDGSDPSPAAYRIMDMMGRTVASQTVTDSHSPVYMGRELPAGNYIAEVVQGSNRQVIKIVKMN